MIEEKKASGNRKYIQLTLCELKMLVAKVEHSCRITERSIGRLTDSDRKILTACGQMLGRAEEMKDTARFCLAHAVIRKS